MRSPNRLSAAMSILLMVLAVSLVGCNADDGDTNISTSGSTATDTDGDGIADTGDNCPNISNANQLDTDSDGQGDACDGDIDNDGFTNEVDNCPLVANADQKDFDNDDIGDVCDPLNDRDGDGIPDDTHGELCTGGETANCDDNCPTIPNSAQTDSNGNGVGDACEGDQDDDGYFDNAFGTVCSGGETAMCDDNCPTVPNGADDTDTAGAPQSDENNNGVGTACENYYHCSEFGNDLQVIANVVADGLTAAATGLCDPENPGCTVADVENTIDDIEGNFATATLTTLVTATSASIEISNFGKVLFADVVPPAGKSEGGKAGFVIENPSNLFSAEFASNVAIETYLDDLLVDSSDTGTQFQVDLFEQATVPEESPKVLLTIGPITGDFNKVLIRFSADALSLESSNKVFGACYSLTAAPPPPPEEQAAATDAFIQGCNDYIGANGGQELCDGLSGGLSNIPSLDGDPTASLVEGCESFAEADANFSAFAPYCVCFADPEDPACAPPAM